MSASAADVALSCQPNREGGSFLFPYTVTNNGTADIFVFDAVPTIDPATRQAKANPDRVTIALAEDGYAHVVKGIPPLPPDRDVAVQIIPLAAKLPPGGSLQRSLRVPLPFAETSAYFTDLTLRQYEQVDIKGVIFAVQFLRATLPGLAAAPDAFGSELYRVVAPNTAAQAQRVSQTFTTKGLSILKRKDAFPRPPGG